MLDPVANFITLTLTTGYDQNAVSVVVVSGGSSLPVSGSFNMTWFNSTDYPNPGDDPNVEVVRVNGAAISGNTLPLIRAQEGTAASPKNISGKTYKLILGVTAKMIQDIGNNLQKPWYNVELDGAIDGSNRQFTLHGLVPPFDPNSLEVKLARQPQEQGIDYTFSGVTVTYVIAPDPSLSGQPHTAKYQ
jgi:hypothetical protein